MNPKTPAPPSTPLVSARDIYYVLFRHKWLIVIIAAVGVIASIVLRQSYPIYYSSEARVYIKYVVDTKPLTAEGVDAQVTSMNTGDSILSAEQDMLTSLDVCTKVAKLIGPAKILGTSASTNEMDAALVIQHGLIPTKERSSPVIHIFFTNPNRELVQPVLAQVISAYEAEHDEVHRPKSGDKLTEGIDTEKGKVSDAESRLLAAEKKADITSPEDSKRNAALAVEKIQGRLSDLQMDMQVEALLLSDLRKGLPAMPATPTNLADMTNKVPEAPAAIAQEYKTDSAILTSLRNREIELLGYETTNNPELHETEVEIAKTDARCQELVGKYPGLVALKPVEANKALDPMDAYKREVTKAQVLAVQFNALTNQLAQARLRQTQIINEEQYILDLQREAERYRANLDSFQKRQAEADLDGILEAGNTQISVFEEPTPPMGDFIKVNKICAGVMIGGFILALVLPFLIEFYLDQSLKRPADIQSRLGVPFFVSMPKLSAKAQRGALNPEKKVPLLPATAGEVPTPEAAAASANGNGNGAPPAPAGNGHIAPWEQRHALRPFFETLRDRLMTYFEVINLTHKPKLVAVTSCGEGAGVTTTAAGLASALSETGDGNVLLVNMNVQDGEAHHFYRGKLTCGLEEALERDKRNAACVHENLFIAKDVEINENLPRVLPKRFSHLVPKMRASDYDYIIFDMPPMSQISITPRLARYMDMVLLVIESEKTDRDAAKNATNLLLESKTNVGVVLNKSREHLPRRLQRDI